MSKIKVLVINPWGVKNDEYYLSGFCSALSKYVHLTLCTNYYYRSDDEKNYVIKRVFFKRSERMYDNLFRKIVRGIEYIKTYINILIDEEVYDVIHIHWLLLYPFDRFMLFFLKKKCKKMILTAHDVIPHVNHTKYIAILNEIYRNFDLVFVHGEYLKKEMNEYFPSVYERTKIYFHGVYYDMPNKYVIDDNVLKYKNKIEKYSKVFIMPGAIFYNKGTDRLIKIWAEYFKEKDALLIIAGKVRADYLELIESRKILCKIDNILFLDHYIEDNLMNYFINSSDAIVLPYRHASMSGVVFTAANFKKTVMCTKTGVLADYIEDGVDGFICDNEDIDIKNCLEKLFILERDVLRQMGSNLSKNIMYKYNWENIVLNQIIINY